MNHHRSSPNSETSQTLWLIILILLAFLALAGLLSLCQGHDQSYPSLLRRISLRPAGLAQQTRYHLARPDVV